MVASLDKNVTQFKTLVGPQQKRVEEIADLTGKMRQCIRKFYENNTGPDGKGRAPERIIIFRDGVAQNMFAKVIKNEIAAVQKACVEEGGDGYVPEIVFIVCQVNVHTKA